MLRARIIMLMAGRETEIECLGKNGGGDGNDLREIRLTLPEAGVPGDGSDESIDRYAARLRVKARTLVRRHRAIIERVADALIKRSTLSAKQIDAIVRRKYPGLVSRIDPESISFEERYARNMAWAKASPVKIRLQDGTLMVVNPVRVLSGAPDLAPLQK
jgi:hypothetical protein